MASTAYDKRLRRALMRSRKVDINQLDKFDDEVRESNASLVNLVLENNVISEEELLALMATAAEIPPIDLNKIGAGAEVLEVLEKSAAIKYLAFPVAKLGNILTIALADPFDHSKIENLEIVTECRIQPVLSTESAIRKAIDEKYIKAVEEEMASAEEARQAVQAVVGTDFDDIIDESLEGHAGPKEEEGIVNEVDKGIIRLANKVIIDAYQRGVSDIHIEPYHGRIETEIRFRTDGDCYVYQRVPNQIKRALVSRLKLMAGLDIAERRLPQDGKIQFKKFVSKLNIELRLATIPTVNGNEDAVMRILASSKPMPLENMGFSERNLEEFKKVIRFPYGLILVVGPTGSGKTTTLHSAMGYINEPKRKIWTAEDPVEITQKGLRQVQIQSKIGYTFARAMRAFLRADPDVIMVGEMRDFETASMGIEASLTGHLVLSTLHTNSAPETVVRLIDMGLDPFNFADALLGVMAQRLTRRLCICKQLVPLSQEEYDEIKTEYGAKYFPESRYPYHEGMEMYQPKGCPKCSTSGHKGRLAIHEFLIGTDPIKALIQRKGKAEEIREVAIREGMTTLKQDGIEKCLQGLTSMLAVRAVCIK